MEISSIDNGGDTSTDGLSPDESIDTRHFVIRRPIAVVPAASHYPSYYDYSYYPDYYYRYNSPEVYFPAFVYK